MGLPVTEELLITASMATAAYVRRRFPGVPCYLLAKGDAVDDFHAAGVPIVGPDGAPDAGVVVIGGAEDELTYARLNHAYRLLLAGARLVAMHRNTAWLTAEGMALDSGPFITALATAAGTRATVIGKPAAAFFRQAIRDIGLPATALAMVGDDARNDLVAGAAAWPAWRAGSHGQASRPGGRGAGRRGRRFGGRASGPIAESASVAGGLPARPVTVKIWRKSVTPGPAREGRRGPEPARRRSCRARRPAAPGWTRPG